MCANSDYYTANLNTANQWQPKIIFITAACSVQSLLYRHVLNQILSLPLSSYCVSISGVKPPANNHFLENNHNCTLTRQTRLQHSPETTLQEKKKNLCSIFPLPMSTSSSSFKETYLLGKGALRPSAWEGSGCDLGTPLWGILAPASPQEGLHPEAWSLLGKHHPVTCAQISTFLVIIKALVLASSYVVLVFIMQDWFARNISQRGS